MSDLLLNSLEVEGYRAFDHLVIPKLGRINLVVGKNNVGKSSLLEALWLYVKRAALPELRDVLRARDEVPEGIRVARDRMWDVKNLFYGRPDIQGNPKAIKIGSGEKPDGALELAIKWYVTQRGEEGVLKRILVDDLVKQPEANPYIVITVGNKRVTMYSLDRLFGRFSPPNS